MWNRQDGCCSDRLDGMLFEYFDADGELIISQEVLGLAANSDGGISSASGAAFPLASGGMLAPFNITAISVDAENNTVSITWSSSPTGSYAVDATDEFSDPEDWSELDDGIEGEPDSPTTTFIEQLGEPTAVRYYRIREL